MRGSTLINNRYIYQLKKSKYMVKKILKDNRNNQKGLCKLWKMSVAESKQNENFWNNSQWC